MLTDRIKELIAKANIISFESWKPVHSSTSIDIFQTAETARIYLTDADYQQIVQLSPQTSDLIPISQLLRDRVVEIVDEARAKVLDRFPHISEPGGGLHPPERAEACWRDFWHYLRPITYGLAGGQSQYTSAEGLKYMELLYRELKVPLDAMAVGLEGLKTASLARIEPSQHAIVAPYFDHLISQLTAFDRLRILLSHNFDLSDTQVPAFSREEFTQLFSDGFQTQPEIACRQVENPHWIVEITCLASAFTAVQIGDRCAQILAAARLKSLGKVDFDILILGGIKTTPATSDAPDALQPHQWGVDVVETKSGEQFLRSIDWESTIATKSTDSIFKVESLATA